MATSLALIVGPGQAPAQARPGELDPTFGAGGKVTTDFAGNGDQARAVIVQSDGKVVAAGSAVTSQDGNTDFALARYDPDGFLDPTFGFGADGKVTTDFGGFPPVDDAHALVQQSDGKLVAAGGIFTGSADLDTAFALARYNPDGTLDPTFGAGGKVTTDFANDETATSLAVQADGKLVAAGTANSAEGARFALVRYNPDGTLDPTFGTSGVVTTTFDGSVVVSVGGLAVQADGELVVAGTVASGPFGNFDFALARYQPNGALDPTFGSGGTVTTDLMGGDDDAEALVVQADGKPVVAGSFSSATAFDFALARYQPNGALDPTFSRDGKVTTDFGSSDGARALALQADGKLVAAGFALSGVGNDFALARYRPNGALDRTFGRAGKVTTDFAGPSADDQVNGLAVQADGSLVAAGVAGRGGGTADFALARYRTQ